MSEYITPNYETISVIQKRDLMELMNSSLLNAFSEEDYYDVLNIFHRIIERLEQIEKGEYMYKELNKNETFSDTYAT